MADVQDALLAWLAGDVKRLVRDSRKAKKQFKDKPDTDSNSDEESADYIPMEKVSRAFVKQKNKSDEKDLNDKIKEQIKETKTPTVKAPEEVVKPEGAMDGVVETYQKEEEKVRRSNERQKMEDSIRGRQRDETGKIVRPKKRDGTTDPLTDSEVQRRYGGDGGPEPVEDVPVVESKTESTSSVVPPPDPLSALDLSGSKSATANLSQPSGVIPLQETTGPAPTPAPGLPVDTTPTAPAELSVSLPEAEVMSDKPNEALKALNIGADGPALDKQEATPSDFSDLSNAFQDAASRKVSIAGIDVPASSAAYDAASTAQGLLASANSAIPQLPMLSRRLGAYIFKPYDAIAGTTLFDKHNATTDQMENFIKGTGLVKEPQNFAERAAQALGAMAIPFPGASAAKVGENIGGRLAAEMMLPGTIIREGQSVAATYAASAIGSVGINEGLYQTLKTIDHLRITNPPVPNSKGDVEPRVISVPASEAKVIQQKMDNTIKSFVPSFAEASYSDVAVTSLAALAGAYAAYRGVRKIAGSSVENRTIRDPLKQTPDASPVSVTSASEATRSMAQDGNNVLESQAMRAGDKELANDIGTQTRSGAKARIEYMHDTGAVELPGYQYQLKTSPKALAEFHLARPVAERQELDWAMATMDQVDHATVQGARKNAAATGGPGMPAAADVQRAQSILNKPENAGVVAANREITEAMLGVYQASGRFDANAIRAMRNERPNYAHVIETGDIVTENGVARPMTYFEKLKAGMNKKAQQVESNIVAGSDLDSAQMRTQVNGPNQRMSPLLSNVAALHEAVEFGLQNDIKTRFIDALKADAEMSKSVVKMKPNSNGLLKDSTQVETWRNGKSEKYGMEKIVGNALNYAPYSTFRGLATIKNISQSLTTGVFAPWFAATSATMEAGIGSVTRLRGTRLGYLDQVLQAVSGGKLALPGDMLGTGAAMVTAGFNNWRAESVKHSTQLLEKALLADPSLNVAQVGQALGGARYVNQIARGLALGHNVVVQDIVDNGKKLYAESAKGTGNRIGALHSSQNEMMRNINAYDDQSVKDEFLRHLGGDQGGVFYNAGRKYMRAMADIHDWTKLAYIEQNMGRIPESTLARETRNLGGDLGKRGIGLGSTGYNLKSDTNIVSRGAVKAVANPVTGNLADIARDSIRYANPHIQGVTRILESFARQPTTTLMGIASAVTIPYMASLAWAMHLDNVNGNADHTDYLLNRREEWRKTNYLSWAVPGRPPEEGMNIRMDPAFGVFGYPVIEALDSVFGIRKHIGMKQNRQEIPQEQQGMASALADGLKEFVGMGVPWPLEMGAAAYGIAARNIGDPGYARGSEKTSGTGGSGVYSSSALSASTQMMLESILGVVGKAGIHGVDAWVSTEKGSTYLEKAANAAKQVTYDLSGQIPGAGNIGFFGTKPNSYTQSATPLADNTRKDLNAARKIMKAINSDEKQLLNTVRNTDDSEMAVPNIRQGYVGEVKIPPEVKQQYDAVKEMIKQNGELGDYTSERSRITQALNGLRGVNAGNIGRHVLVRLKDPIDNVDYMIVHAEDLKREGAAERFAALNPKMTKGSAPDAKRKVEPKVAADSAQRPRPIEKRLGNIPSDTDIDAMRPPTLAEVSRLQNRLNMRRGTLDRDAAATINELQQKNKFKLRDLADKIKLEADGGDDDED